MLDGVAAMTRFLRRIATEPDIARVPVMVDSSRWSVLEAGLRQLGGKGIVNSISLKEGEAEFIRQARLCRRYGAAVVVMAFDEQGQGDSVERRVAILTRAYRLLVDVVGFEPCDIILDANIFAIATGIEEHNRYALSFIEAVRPDQGRAARDPDLGRRLERLVRVPGQRPGPGGDPLGLPVPRDPGRAGHGDRQRGRPAGVRRDRARPPRAGRGRRPRSPPGCHRTAPRDRDPLCRRGRDDPGRRGPVVARPAGRGAPDPCPGQGHRHVDRRGHRRGPPAGDPAARGDRGSADGRDAGRRRPVRVGQDVPAPGGQERPGHEEGRRPPRPVPRGRPVGQPPAGAARS